MEPLPFKADETLAFWQWLVLIGFCCALVAAAIAARMYARRGKSGGLLAALNIKSPAKPLHNVQIQQRVLSRNAKLYYLEVQGKTHLIFETDKGLIELEQNSVCDDQS